MATHDYNTLLVAYIHGQDNSLKQQAIADRANLGGQAQVSKLLQQARAKGYLREVFQFPSDVPNDIQRQIENSFFRQHSDLEAALMARAEELNDRRYGGSPFKRLHVCAAPGLGNEDGKSREKAFLSFGSNAAEIVTSYIDQADTCCVAWGRTIDAAVRHVRQRTPVPADRGKIFMPIAGEPTNYEPNGISPSDAAQTLAAAWPGSQHLSLRGVQARIPKAVYERDEDHIILDLVNCSRNYQKIFGGSPENNGRPLISQVAMMLTGIGDARTSGRASGVTGLGDPWWLETADAESRSVLSLAVGNIGGIWIPHAGADNADMHEIEQVNEHWLGATHIDLEKCSRNGGTPRRPGVVVLAVEPEKAEIVLEALYLINVLIVSRQLADALAAKLLS